jgi:hypothetical protein
MRFSNEKFFILPKSKANCESSARPVIEFRNRPAPPKSSNPFAWRSAESVIIELTVLLFVRHETANEIGDSIGGGIQGEVPRIKNVNLSLRNVTVVHLGLRQLKR